MRRVFAVLLLLGGASQLPAAGLLIPNEKSVAPLAMVQHKVTINISDQVAITKVVQSFRNHTNRKLEATYVFPVPKGASVQKFAMWVDGKKMEGELVEAKNARSIYTSIVQRTQDPGLLEYMDRDLLKMRVFPIKPNADQKVTFQYISTVPKDSGLVHYTYPLKTDGKAVQTLDGFSVQVNLKSQHSVQNIYSPSHAVRIIRPNDKQATVTFEKKEARLDRNFDLYYTAGTKDVGLTSITHRPAAGKKGHFMLLISPRADMAKENHVPRDVVFVLDTSGSMRGQRIAQAKSALNYCLGNLHKKDRFAVIHFATTVNRYHRAWLPASDENTGQAKKWVSRLNATGGTNIDMALADALKMRTKDKGRTFTVVFFTDGQPTVGVTNTKQILKNVFRQNSKNTRIFTFGVGNDVNSAMLDQMAEQSRAVSTFVRESEDIEDKISRMYNKISRPVLTNLRLTAGKNVQFSEVYPPELPDLFHGSQLVVIGRYDGSGQAAIKLSGRVGLKEREFVYETGFRKRTNDEKSFVEDLWARRKVGYLLDQIRRNGEKKELVDEVITLAKRHGITTPYTSYLIVPDAPVTVARAHRSKDKSKPNVAFNQRPHPPGAGTPPGLRPGGFGGGFAGGNPKAGGKGKGPFGTGRKGGSTTAKAKKSGNKKSGDNSPELPVANKSDTKAATAPIPVATFIKKVQKKKGDAEKSRGDIAGRQSATGSAGEKDANRRLTHLERVKQALRRNELGASRTGKLGVDLSIETGKLRGQSQVSASAIRRIGKRSLLEIGGVWIDRTYHAKLKTITVKALSKAYFRILERHPEMKDVFRLGNHLVWVTPSGTALVIDLSTGQSEMPDSAIDALFTRQK